MVKDKTDIASAALSETLFNVHLDVDQSIFLSAQPESNYWKDNTCYKL